MRFALLIAIGLMLALPATAQQDSMPNGAFENSSLQAPASQPIALESPDAEIAARLRDLFAAMDGVKDIRANVSGGVVSLSGSVLSASDSQKAEAVAARLAGVVSVNNQIEVDYRLGRRLQPMADRADEIARRTIAFLPLLIVSLFVFLGFWLLGRLLTRSTPLFQRIAPNPLVQTLAAQIIRLIFILVGVILAMRIMGATALLGSVLGAAGVIGLAAGFAVRDTIENYIASILLSIRRPFAPNDHVIIEGFEGRVTRLNSRATFLTSFDGSELRIPNAIVYKAKITNFSQIPERRFEFLVGIGYENNLCHALATALAATKSVESILTSPEPAVLIDALEESTISLKIFGWVDQKRTDFGKARSAAIKAVKTAFDEQSVSMPAPIQNIRAIDEAKLKPAPTRQSRKTEAASDTSADRTIEGKVNALRAKGEADLLTAEAPRE